VGRRRGNDTFICPALQVLGGYGLVREGEDEAVRKRDPNPIRSIYPLQSTMARISG
jgi:hypothetical protein